MKIKGTKEDLISLKKCIKNRWEPIVANALAYDRCDLCSLDNRRSEEIDAQDDILDFNTVECQFCILNRYVGDNLRCATGSLYSTWNIDKNYNGYTHAQPIAVKMLNLLREIRDNLEVVEDYSEISAPIINKLREQHENW